MEFKTSIDKAGRILLPKHALKQMRLPPGDELRIQSDGDAITLRPVHSKAILIKKLGIWAYQSAPSSLSIKRLIDKGRTKRLREFL
jgi:AbrB family looped-hinge helix DNA binding protein